MSSTSYPADSSESGRQETTRDFLRFPREPGGWRSVTVAIVIATAFGPALPFHVQKATGVRVNLEPCATRVHDEERVNTTLANVCLWHEAEVRALSVDVRSSR